MKRFPLILAALFLLSSCGPPNLSRPSAEQQLAATQEIERLRTEIPLRADAIGNGEGQGLWTRVAGATVMFTAERRTEIFETIRDVKANTVFARNPADIRVAVTGISDRPGTTNLKDVEFSWEYSNLTGLIRRFASKGGSGKALFRLFDDGWRVESVTTSANGLAVELSDSEKQKIESDIAAETQRKAKLEEERLRAEAAQRELLAQRMREAAERQRKGEEARRAAEAILQIRIQDSKKPNQRVLQMPVNTQYANGKNGANLVITDVGFEFASHYGNAVNIWFGHIAGWGYGPGPLLSVSVRPEFSQKYGFEHTFLVPVPEGQRDHILSMLNSAVKAWRAKYGDFPPAALQ